MKHLQLAILAVLMFILGAIVGIKSERMDNSTKFIWNDVEESIPIDGSTIIIEFTDEVEGVIYLGSVEANR
jgi:uncharacterized protein YxeA